MTNHRIGHFYDGKKKRYILFEVRAFNDRYCWRLKFKTFYLSSVYFRHFSVTDWINHRIGDETTYIYESNIFRFDLPWDRLRETSTFKDIRHDFSNLKASVNIYKFSELYEKYRIEDKLLYQL